MAYLAHPSQQSTPRRAARRKSGHNPLAAPVLVFAAVCIFAAAYVAYVLWPRWPDAPVALGAPSMILIAGSGGTSDGHR